MNEESPIKKTNNIKRHLVILYIIIAILGLKIFTDSNQVKYPLANDTNYNVKYDSEDETKREEEIQDAKLIIYGKSYIKGNKHITTFDKVLWGELDHVGDQILDSHTIEEGSRYGDSLILFYHNSNIDDYKSSWAVYDGRIPAWGNKDITQFIKRLKHKK